MNKNGDDIAKSSEKKGRRGLLWEVYLSAGGASESVSKKIGGASGGKQNLKKNAGRKYYEKTTAKESLEQSEQGKEELEPIVLLTSKKGESERSTGRNRQGYQK